MISLLISYLIFIALFTSLALGLYFSLQAIKFL